MDALIAVKHARITVTSWNWEGLSAPKARHHSRLTGLGGTVRKTGSSDIRWGSWGESAGGEEHAEPVVVAVAEAAGEAAVQLDDPVHGLSATVR